MDSPGGRVLTIHNDSSPRHAEIEVVSAPRCARCASGKGCGAGFGDGDARPRRIDALIPAGFEVEVGDQVSIELAPDSLLGAAFVVYGAPLAGAVIGAGAAYLYGFGDLGSALLALAGLAAGMLIGRSRLRRDQCLRRFTPTIVATRLARQ